MTHHNTPFGIKFAPEHFPQGTTFVVGNLTNHKGIIFEAVKVIKNGYQSYVIETTACNESLDMCHSFNIDHVTSIIKRGAGPVIVEDYWTYNKGEADKTLIDNKKARLLNTGIYVPSFKTHRIFDYDNLQNKGSGLLSKCNIEHRASVNIDNLIAGLLKQTFVKQLVVGRDSDVFYDQIIFSAPKKRLNRWIKQNINRFLNNVSEANKEYDEEVAENFNVLFDDYFESDACHFSYLDHFSNYDLTEQGK